MEIKLPSVRTVSAVFNIYLILSICMVQVYATKKPIDSKKLFNESDEEGESENVMRTMRSDPRVKTLLSVNNIIEVARVEQLVSANNDQTQQSKISNRALDIYEEDEEFFRPSVRFQQPGSRIRTVSRGDSERYGQRLRRPQRKRLGDRRQSYLREDEHSEEDAPYRSRQRQRQRADAYQDSYLHEYEPSHAPAKRPHNPPSHHLRRPPTHPLHRQQQHRKEGGDRFPAGRPPPVTFPDYELDEDYFNHGVDEPSSPGLLDTIFSLIKPKKPKRPESDLNEPSIEWLYNDIDTEEKNSLFSSPTTDLFIPNNNDYDDDGNIDYRDQADIENDYVPEYDFKDVIHSIRNNESRIVTLKKFLSAASGLSDRAGTDPVYMLWSMPLTILSILGVFYAVSAVAVLGYKYVLLTTGNSNGQAVAVLPVILLFTVPLVLSVVFLVARGSLDGQINLGRLARGDLKHGLRQDFDSVDFAYDMGVGATALLGLGWIVSVTL